MKLSEQLSFERLELPKQKINQFKENNIYNIQDLVDYLPKKYYDFTQPKKIKDLQIGEVTCFIGVINEIKKGKNGYVSATFTDESRWFIKCVWFNNPYIDKYLNYNTKYIVCGKVVLNEFNGKQYKQFLPSYFSDNISSLQKIIPIYKDIDGMTEKYFLSVFHKAMSYYKNNILKEYIDNDLKKEFKLCSIQEAYDNIHYPKTMLDIEIGKNRLIFDMLFKFNVRIMQERINNTEITSTDIKLEKFKTCKPLNDSIPFELTDDQKKAIKFLYAKIKSGQRINSLVQGDVGCGKTIIAIFLALACAENGYQTVILAPTEILAKQHYKECLDRLGQFSDIKIAFLSGTTKGKEKTKILKEIEDGTINIIVGTHAVLSEGIKFNKLLLSIVDEQHRFGVEQREKLNSIHNINMSATPIPRTLGMAVYGNLIDIINVRTKPANRKPIITKYIKEEQKVYDFMLSEIKNGRQCYVICPLIDESESEKLANVQNVNQTYVDICEYFNKKGIKAGLIYGGKSKKEKEQNELQLQKFSSNEIQILVATTIVEVGVNVPNSTVIVIKNAERFGLAQLHQLRGRVGRGSYQSYCILQSPKENDRKIEVMCSTNDGFEVAEFDMQLRGTGDILGNRQSGYNKYIENILSNPVLFEKIQQKVTQMYNDNSINRYSELFKIIV